MFKNLKLKLASARVKKANVELNIEKTGVAKQTLSIKVKRAIADFSNCIKRNANKFWNWVRSLNTVGMINSTLLVAIIVLFSALILNIINFNKKSDIKSDVQIVQNETSYAATDSSLYEPEMPIPNITKAVVIKRTNKTLFKNEKSDKIQASNQPTILSGDIIIDGDFPSPKLITGTIIQGSLYLQNMHKYTLPCGVYVKGDLVLRNVGMLKFAGQFVVTGNIYVSRNSSFGPLPKNARLDGQVIF